MTRKRGREIAMERRRERREKRKAWGKELEAQYRSINSFSYHSNLLVYIQVVEIIIFVFIYLYIRRDKGDCKIIKTKRY